MPKPPPFSDRDHRFPLLANDDDDHVLVVGARGMLGRAVVEELDYQGISHLADTHHINSSADVDLTIKAAREAGKGLTHIINCAGAVPAYGKAREAEVPSMVFANAYLPACLAGLAKDAVLIHVSTDCVFNGDADIGTYHCSIMPAPADGDFYGQSKALGELAVRQADHEGRALIVRTSFIGPDHGLLRWLLSQQPGTEVPGWLHARWSGSTVYEVARQLVKLTTPRSNPTGASIVHLATAEPWSKYRVLRRLVDIFELPLTVRPTPFPVINRALTPTRIMADLDDPAVAAELRARAGDSVNDKWYERFNKDGSVKEVPF